MKSHHSAVAAALVFLGLSAAHAAEPVQIQLTGNVVNFLAVTEVKGYNCSQYNPCNSSDPAYSSTVSFGSLANGQSFQATMSLQAGSNQIQSSEWASTDGKAAFAWPDGSVYFHYQQTTFSVNANNQDVLSLSTQTPTKNGSRPVELSSKYTLTFAAGTLKGGAITGDELAAAINDGKLLSATGNATFDSCTMVQNYWGSACGGRMTYAIGGVSINGASTTINGVVPEPQTWATMLLGLGLMTAARKGAQARQRQSGSRA